MKVQVLVAAMHQKDHSLLEKMNIQSDAIVGNQYDCNSVESFVYNDNSITYLNFFERGVGLNRNNTLMRATGDILLLADDDITYRQGYPEIVRKAFEEKPDADAIIFNVETVGADMSRRVNSSSKRVRIYNALNYGAVRIAVRRSSLLRSRISFSQCFGGGTVYSAGEDSLFICDMLRKGFKIYTSPQFIATVDQTTSTWFRGYNEKYLYDKGAFFKAAFGNMASVMCIVELIRHKGFYSGLPLTFLEKYKIMRSGSRGYNIIKSWDGSISESID